MAVKEGSIAAILAASRMMRLVGASGLPHVADLPAAVPFAAFARASFAAALANEGKCSSELVSELSVLVGLDVCLSPRFSWLWAARARVADRLDVERESVFARLVANLRAGSAFVRAAVAFSGSHGIELLGALEPLLVSVPPQFACDEVESSSLYNTAVESVMEIARVADASSWFASVTSVPLRIGMAFCLARALEGNVVTAFSFEHWFVTVFSAVDAAVLWLCRQWSGLECGRVGMIFSPVVFT
jgi:hypothetical protein